MIRIVHRQHDSGSAVAENILAVLIDPDREASRYFSHISGRSGPPARLPRWGRVQPDRIQARPVTPLPGAAYPDQVAPDRKRTLERPVLTSLLGVAIVNGVLQIPADGPLSGSTMPAQSQRPLGMVPRMRMVIRSALGDRRNIATDMAGQRIVQAVQPGIDELQQNDASKGLGIGRPPRRSATRCAVVECRCRTG